MGRHPQPEIKQRLLDVCTDYALEHGLPDRLEPLANAAGASSRMLIYHFGSRDDLLRAVQDRPRKRLVVAWANDAHTLEAVNAAVEAGLVEAILVGDEPLMAKVCQEHGFPMERFRLIHAATDREAASTATVGCSMPRAWAVFTR